MFLVFLFQKFYRFCGQGYLPNGIVSLGRLYFQFFPCSAVFPEFIVQPLDLHGLKLVQLDIAQLGADVGVDEQTAVLSRILGLA